MKPDEIRSAVLATIASIAPEADVQRIGPDRPLRPQIDLDSIVAYLAAGRAERRRASSRTPAKTLAELPTVHHVVKDTPVTVRPLRAADMTLSADFVRHLSMDSRYKRFMVTVRVVRSS